MALLTFEQWLKSSPYSRKREGGYVRSRGEDSTPINVRPQEVRNAYSAYAEPLKSGLIPQGYSLSNTSPYSAANAVSGQSQYLTSGLADASLPASYGGVDVRDIVNTLQGAPQSVIDNYLNTLKDSPYGQLVNQEANTALTPYLPQKSGLAAFFNGPGPVLLAGAGLAGVTAPATGLLGAGAAGGDSAALADLAAEAEFGAVGGSNVASESFFGDYLGGLFPPSNEIIPGVTGFGSNVSGVTAGEIIPGVSGFPAAAGVGAGTAAAGSLLPGLGATTGAGLLDSGFDVSKLLSGLGSLSSLSGLGGSGFDVNKLLFGSGGPSGLFGDRGLLGTSLALAPSLAAIAYARNTDPFDTSRLESAYQQITPSALTGPYDLQTASGREALTSGLQRRGVTGSSFANSDIANYNMVRDVGRQNLLGTSASMQSSIAQQILNAQIAERQQKNELYGRALLALSGGLSPRVSGGLFA